MFGPLMAYIKNIKGKNQHVVYIYYWKPFKLKYITALLHLIDQQELFLHLQNESSYNLNFVQKITEFCKVQGRSRNELYKKLLDLSQNQSYPSQQHLSPHSHRQSSWGWPGPPACASPLQHFLWDMNKTKWYDGFYIEFRQHFAKETFSYDEHLKS